MANIIIKSDERRIHETYVLDSFRKSADSSVVERDAAETIAARSREAYQNLKKMEGK